MANTFEGSTQPEERPIELFYQLSSPDRRRILAELQKENLKLNEVARRLDMTSTETLRQLHRLVEASLLKKLPDGKYGLTRYAKLVLDNSSSLDFISKYREYFQEHDTSLLPCEFRARLGELSGCELIPGTVETINKVTEMFLAAQNRIDSVILGTEALIDIEKHRIQEGIKIRWLMHESFSQRAPIVLSSWSQLPEIRSTPMVAGHIIVTDKSAMLTIRHNDGTMSYDSFYGENASFMKWTDDFFTHEWERAKPWKPWINSEGKVLSRLI